MSLMTSLYSGETGLTANSLDLSVIGDNIANGNTIGFKGSRAAFEDALAQVVMNNSQMGLGTELEKVQRLMSQGALTNTGVATDLALNGAGFFMMKGSYGGQSGNFYTRAGQFTVDNLGYLVSLNGLRVQGYPADATGQVMPGLGDLHLGAASASPKATANITVKANLNADTTASAWDANNPGAPPAFPASATLYDSLGAAHQVTVYFNKSATAGTWEWHAVTDGAGVEGGQAGQPSPIASGTLAFDPSNGMYSSSTQTSTFTPKGQTVAQPLNFDFSGMTQFSGDSAVSFVNQDGYDSGSLASISVDSRGHVMGSFTNGQKRTLGQVAIAGFSAADELGRVGGNLYTQTVASGDPSIGTAGDGGRGTLTAGALEQSNVDMASEFIRMIAAQRGFQANSKTISTADQLLQELMNLKR